MPGLGSGCDCSWCLLSCGMRDQSNCQASSTSINDPQLRFNFNLEKGDREKDLEAITILRIVSFCMDSEDPSAKRLDDATKNVRTGKGATPAAISKKDTKQVQSKAPVGKGKLVAGAKKKGTHDKKADSGDAFAEAARLAALKKEKEDKDNFDEALDGAVTGVIDEEEEDKAGEELDDGWESDLGDADNCLKKKATSDPYINACKVLGIVPVSYFAERINTSEILLKHRGLGPKGAQAIASVLEVTEANRPSIDNADFYPQSNTTITLLDLSDNWIESGGAHLGRSLQINRTLTYLNLTNNKLGLQGATEIAEMLSFNGTLKTLIMKGNSLGDKEASLLAEGLRQNSTLQVIDLSYNQIGDLGAHSLGSGLVTNDGIKELNLAWNQIRVRGANGFFNYLKDNAHISTLHIQDNGIGDNGLASYAYE
ncbi:hypothetical protein BC830DRAFT_825542 [Chytriomyces sp. MP71]|nr:hypothetical protein BC830DRAFT_825542 [Chytriomyces sp. MP71]